VSLTCSAHTLFSHRELLSNEPLIDEDYPCHMQEV
jgi:hypothetical protein